MSIRNLPAVRKVGEKPPRPRTPDEPIRCPCGSPLDVRVFLGDAITYCPACPEKQFEPDGSFEVIRYGN